MDNTFIRLSELKANATKRALMQHNQSGGTRVVKQIIGVNPLNKEWVDDADKKLRNALKQQGFARVQTLYKALDVLYFCDWILQRNSASDPHIKKQIHTAETSYLNACHSFIESNIHSSSMVVKAFNTLISAIDVLGESNPQMAGQYKQMLTRYQSLYAAREKMNELCSVPLHQFQKKHSLQIVSLLSQLSGAFKMYPSLKEQLLETVKDKLDELLKQTTQKLDEHTTSTSPTLQKALAIISEFTDVYAPLTDHFVKKRYTAMLEKQEYYTQIKKLIERDYTEWTNVYQYYTLPRNQIDETKVYAVIKAIETQRATLSLPFKEIATLSPSPDTILSLLKSLVNEQDKDSVIYYFKIENELLNAPDDEKKLSEIVRFLKHLTERLSDKAINPQLHSELLRMKMEFAQMLDNSVEAQIVSYFSTSQKTLSFTTFFDKLLAHFYELNDLKTLSKWQSIKKSIQRALDIPTLIETLQKDFDFMSSLPVSTAKDALKEKLTTQIDQISESIPTMALYKIGDVQEYIKKITAIENTLHPVTDSTFLSPTSAPKSKDSQKLHIFDKFTARHIFIYDKDIIEIGRDDDNDIILHSDWVSGQHCTLDFRTKQLVDNDSTNGTYINKKQITTCFIDDIDTFNTADAFEISIKKGEGFYILKVIKVTDTKDTDYIQTLLNTEFVWLKKNSIITINTISGKIVTSPTTEEIDTMLVISADGHFTIADKENSKTYNMVKENEKISTDRFTFYLD